MAASRVMRVAAAALTVFGLAVVVGAMVLGLSSVHRGGVSCGSAFKPSQAAADGQDYFNALTGRGVTDVAGQCKQATSDRKPLVLALAIPGALLFIAGAGGVLWTTLPAATNGSTLRT